MSPGHATHFPSTCTVSQANHSNSHFTALARPLGQKTTATGNGENVLSNPISLSRAAQHCTGCPGLHLLQVRSMLMVVDTCVRAASHQRLSMYHLHA